MSVIIQHQGLLCNLVNGLVNGVDVGPPSYIALCAHCANNHRKNQKPQHVSVVLEVERLISS